MGRLARAGLAIFLMLIVGALLGIAVKGYEMPVVLGIVFLCSMGLAAILMTADKE